MMDKGVVIVALGLLALANRSLALSCPHCDPATDCGPLPNCAYGVNQDACGCCDVCAQGPGDPCGGPWGTSGKCGDGLYCMNPCPTPGFLQGPPINQVGVCVGENNATYCNGMHEGLEYHYEYSSRLTAGLREVGRQEASSAFKADVRMQVQSQQVVIVQLSNIMVGDINSEPLPCRESEDQDFQGIEYIPLVDNVDKLQIPFKLQIDKRKLINIIAPGDEPYWITNIRKSIAYLFSLPFLHSKQEPYFDEYGYSPFGECLTRYSLTPIMNELKLKENKKLSIEEDVQLGDSSPDALTKHKGVKGSSKTRKGSKGSKGAKGAKGSKGGTKGGPDSPTASDLVKVPRLADKMWRLTRSIDFEQCLDLVQVHSQGLKMVGTKDSPDDCGERHFSRSHDGTFILRGDLDGLRLEKAEVQGVYTVDALGTNEEHINSFAIQTINLVSVRLIEEEIIIENEGSLYAETQLRHDVKPYIDRGRSPDEFAEPKDVADTTLANLPSIVPPSVNPGTSPLSSIPEEYPSTTREPLTLRTTTVQAMGRAPADRIPTMETSFDNMTVVDFNDAPSTDGITNFTYNGPDPPAGSTPPKPRPWIQTTLAIAQIALGLFLLVLLELKHRYAV